MNLSAGLNELLALIREMIGSDAIDVINARRD